MFARPQPTFRKLNHRSSADRLGDRKRTWPRKAFREPKGAPVASPNGSPSLASWNLPASKNRQGGSQTVGYARSGTTQMPKAVQRTAGHSPAPEFEWSLGSGQHASSDSTPWPLTLLQVIQRLQTPHRTDYQRQQTLQQARQAILHDVLTENDAANPMGGRRAMDTGDGGDGDGGHHRTILWKLTLSMEAVSAPNYIRWVETGPSTLYQKIKHDTSRTLTTDMTFWARVDEAQLVRVLNSFVWKSQEQQRTADPEFEFTYVQGMNVLAAPFVYVLPELDAFYAFNTLLHRHCPTYVQPTLIGVHAGLTLLDLCLKFLDYPLYDHLRTRGLKAELYAFPSVLTLSAGTPPLDQVVRLWDFLFAYGVHLNILCIVAQLIGMRDTLLAAASPVSHLRSLPNIHAATTVRRVLELATQLPGPLYDHLVKHPFDLATAKLFGQKAVSREDALL